MTAARVAAFRAWADREPPAAQQRLHFHFRAVPEAILGTDEVEALVLRRATGDVRLPVAAVVSSVGFLGSPLPDLPHDATTGTLRHEAGRVGKGIYTAGWIKRGPSGLIGSNKACAIETVETLLADLDAGRGRAAAAEAAALRREFAATAVTWAGWDAIDHAERELGLRHGRTRIKITDPAELVTIADRAG